MTYCIAKKGKDSYSLEIMTSHLPLVMGSREEKPEHLGGNERWTSIELKQMISIHPKESRKDWMLEQMYRADIKNPNNKEFQLWQQDSHPIELTTPEITRQKLNFLHNNPVLAGFTDLPENYL